MDNMDTNLKLQHPTNSVAGSDIIIHTYGAKKSNSGVLMLALQMFTAPKEANSAFVLTLDVRIS